MGTSLFCKDEIAWGILQCRDVVDHRDAPIQCTLHHRGFVSVDGNGDALLDELLHHRLQAPNLFLRRYVFGVRVSGLCTDVDDRSAVFDKAVRSLQRLTRLEEQASVRE